MTQQPKTVVVLQYGSGNVHSAVKALQQTGAEVKLSSDPEQLLQADGVVVPGVGAFDAVMQQLAEVQAAPVLAARLAAGKPVLGICVGAQIMFETGTERGTTAPGLGYLSGAVTQLQAATLPHMGWNSITTTAGSTLFAGLDTAMFYFVHSNAATATPHTLHPSLANAQLQLTWAEHENQQFIAAFEAGPLSATQFHPEKSGAAGIKLLTNWVHSL